MGGWGGARPAAALRAQRRLRRLPQLAAAIALVSEISQQLVERKNEAVSEIGSTFEELERALQQRKGLLVRDLEAICGAKQKVALRPVRRHARRGAARRGAARHGGDAERCRRPARRCFRHSWRCCARARRTS